MNQLLIKTIDLKWDIIKIDLIDFTNTNKFNFF